MSGICGIVNIDGGPVDRAVLRAMTMFMAFRGPDAQDTWGDGPVGFGHTMLRTTFESEREHQPCSLDGRVWITADARVDGRDELKAELITCGRGGLAEATDVDLILHAYQAWGTDCVRHLIGDFAFALWDGPRQQLFCARDHFGVKPFFYAPVGRHLVFSNTLNCVRRHPAVTATLNDLAIADFLLFEENKDPATTAFADIRRLPPAHTLTWSAGLGLQTHRYWTLPTELGVRYRPAGDYVEHFRYLLDLAVADRLRTRRVGVEMSGGLDSSSIAAVALHLLSRQPAPFELQAQTIVYDHLIPDQERHYATLVAAKLGIPIHFIVADNYPLYERWDQPETGSPEPAHKPQAAMGADAFRGAAMLSRVFLAGWDGDALLNESPKPYFRTLARGHQYSRLLGGMLAYAVSQRRLVPLAWRDRLRHRFAKTIADARPDDGYPAWINPELEARFDLRARWRQHRAIARADHPTRPCAYQIYGYLANHNSFFDGYDAGVSGLPLEYRHPLMDLRLLDFCLAMPSQPWLVKKHVLREAMRGLLPEAVRTRPKAPLAGSPHQELLMRAAPERFEGFPVAPALGNYVLTDKLPELQVLRRDPDQCWGDLRAYSLKMWMGLV